MKRKFYKNDPYAWRRAQERDARYYQAWISWRDWSVSIGFPMPEAIAIADCQCEFLLWS